MLVYKRHKNNAQVFNLERYFFDLYILASRIRLLVKSHEKFVKAHEKLRKTSPTPDFCPAFIAKTLNLHHQFLQNEFFRGGDLYYICANLGGFSFRCFFPAKQTLVSSLFSNFALVKRF